VCVEVLLSIPWLDYNTMSIPAEKQGSRRTWGKIIYIGCCLIDENVVIGAPNVRFETIVRLVSVHFVEDAPVNIRRLGVTQGHGLVRADDSDGIGVRHR
jgi:hypothetical protein